MRFLSKFLDLFDFTDIRLKRRKKKVKEKPPTIFSDLRNNPEKYMLEAYVEDKELVIRIKKRC